jgi:hypothetical protein
MSGKYVSTSVASANLDALEDIFMLKETKANPNPNSINSDSRSFNDDSSVQNTVHSRTDMELKSPAVKFKAFVPKTYPFSSAVPGIYIYMYVYIHICIYV